MKKPKVPERLDMGETNEHNIAHKRLSNCVEWLMDTACKDCEGNPGVEEPKPQEPMTATEARARFFAYCAASQAKFDKIIHDAQIDFSHHFHRAVNDFLKELE